jgi:hypothetical protein
MIIFFVVLARASLLKKNSKNNKTFTSSAERKTNLLEITKKSCGNCLEWGIKMFFIGAQLH